MKRIVTFAAMLLCLCFTALAGTNTDSFEHMEENIQCDVVPLISLELAFNSQDSNPNSISFEKVILDDQSEVFIPTFHQSAFSKIDPGILLQIISSEYAEIINVNGNRILIKVEINKVDKPPLKDDKSTQLQEDYQLLN